MKKRTSGYSSLYLLKRIAERLQEPGLSGFEIVALRSRYADLVEDIQDRAVKL